MVPRANMCIAEAGAKAKNRPVSQSPPPPLGRPLTQRQGSMTEDKMLVLPSTGSSSTFPRIGVQILHRPALGSLIAPVPSRSSDHRSATRPCLHLNSHIPTVVVVVAAVVVVLGHSSPLTLR
ncbi:uncharacterized protein PAN0_001d0677 [Moesziomyces antarcticus]|uniref:uncharacterized protein n=1 Tax=Pseudozyma antarctica TaxID=84753 RepID=UPI0007196CE8|nr:uncharacterized protein PAN0_001d0677 [Moesziomyces antarcticus]GAK62477.1 hypothetical protein PAN0_001d0677 [Moesziomyces antarcticus]